MNSNLARCLRVKWSLQFFHCASAYTVDLIRSPSSSMLGREKIMCAAAKKTVRKYVLIMFSAFIRNGKFMQMKISIVFLLLLLSILQCDSYRRPKSGRPEKKKVNVCSNEWTDGLAKPWKPACVVYCRRRKESSHFFLNLSVCRNNKEKKRGSRSEKSDYIREIISWGEKLSHANMFEYGREEKKL